MTGARLTRLTPASRKQRWPHDCRLRFCRSSGRAYGPPDAAAKSNNPRSENPGRNPLKIRGELFKQPEPALLLTVAPTRAGKGVGAIIPNLLIAERSVFVIDPKGENARITARRRRDFGPVYVLDPFEISGEPGARFNPAGGLHGESLYLAEDAATLADALVIDSGDAKDGHWNDEAKALIAGVIMYVAAMEKPEARHLDRVRQYLTLPPDAFRDFLQEMAGLSAARGLIARTGGRFLGKTGPEFAGVVSTAQRHTQFLDSPRLADALSRSDFSFADLATGVTSIFLVLPPRSSGDL